MRVKSIPVSKLVPAPDNVKDHDEGNVAAIAHMIREYGFLVPLVVDEENVVHVGNGRLEAAKLLGLEKVPCVVASDLKPEQLRRFAIAENRSGELSAWNPENIRKQLASANAPDCGTSGMGGDRTTQCKLGFE